MCCFWIAAQSWDQSCMLFLWTFLLTEQPSHKLGSLKNIHQNKSHSEKLLAGISFLYLISNKILCTRSVNNNPERSEPALQCAIGCPCPGTTSNFIGSHTFCSHCGQERIAGSVIMGMLEIFWIQMVIHAQHIFKFSRVFTFLSLIYFIWFLIIKEMLFLGKCKKRSTHIKCFY